MIFEDNFLLVNIDFRSKNKDYKVCLKRVIPLKDI